MILLGERAVGGADVGKLGVSNAILDKNGPLTPAERKIIQMHPVWGADHLEAGMAKLLAARTAWSNADAALQVHGGNGYALEYEISRVLCDARILNIFEGAAEIQAQVIARGLVGGRN